MAVAAPYQEQTEEQRADGDDVPAPPGIRGHDSPPESNPPSCNAERGKPRITERQAHTWGWLDPRGRVAYT